MTQIIGYMAKNTSETIDDKVRAKNLGIDVKLYERAAEQAKSEIATSFSFMQPKWSIWTSWLKIFNNQKKDVSAVSDPMLFTHFQTVLASLYEDKLKVNFSPRTKADIERAENLNPLYEFDAIDMDKAIVDYKLTWNALFFGRGLCLMNQWDRKKLCPMPEVVNMLTWYRDPNATSVNGDSQGRGAMRFGGRPISMTKDDFSMNSQYKNIVELTDSENSQEQEAQRQIDEAQGFSTMDDVTGDNRNYTIMEWYTKMYMYEKETINEKEIEVLKMKRLLIGIQNGLIVRFTELKDQDEWGIIDKNIYPDSMSWDGVCVPALIEDKQRANARMLNASLFNVESNSHQMYVYDSTKIKKSSHLNYGFNKHIPVAGDITGAVAPIQRNQVGNEVDYIMSKLQDLAQRATGATEIQQGAMSGAKRSATEVATVSEGADSRFSLSAKIFGWSEKAFARYWYKMYKMYYTKAVDEKIMRVNGLIGFTWKPLTREDIVTDADPDIKVESKLVSEARRLTKLQNFANAYPIFANDPTTNKEFLSREWAQLNGYDSVQISMMFKESPDRIIARDENERIAKGEVVKVNPTDDDYIHMDEHAKEEKATAHIKAHLVNLTGKAKNPQVQEEVAAMQPQQEQPQEQVTPANYSAPQTLQTA